jgi:hypothetical protein
LRAVSGQPISADESSGPGRIVLKGRGKVGKLQIETDGLNMRAPMVMVLCSTLGACSAGEPPPPMDYIPPSVPARPATDAAVQTAIVEAKLIGAVEISDFRSTDFGPGRSVACIRGTSNDSPTNA